MDAAMERDWRLKENDRILTGLWLDLGSRMEKDATWQRILWLTSDYLQPVAQDDERRTILYRDPADGRYWELLFPRPELPEGGPPTLRVLDEEAAREGYQLRE
ncbi:immunity protein 27 of polymorphic toxin system [Geothermobacter ehrlichii]|uniref:Immunity protein 27 of polymorphic toxin system n=2 Tax=Geothermobacter ehrlichii TaxID=213224 RepID=A0A5D3WNM7_9BACT|nr:immunity protein 27 of polymorphic toxin system [Geothermobacter ehrlichii]